MFTRRAAFENNFEAEGRTDWKSKIKKVITTANVLFSTQIQVKSIKKRSSRSQMSFFSLTFSAMLWKKEKKIFGLIQVRSLRARGPQKMVSRAA